MCIFFVSTSTWTTDATDKSMAMISDMRHRLGMGGNVATLSLQGSATSGDDITRVHQRAAPRNERFNRHALGDPS